MHEYKEEPIAHTNGKHCIHNGKCCWCEWKKGRESETVEEFVSDLMQYDLVIEATKRLIEEINQDDETNQPITKIVSQFTKNREWEVYAILADGKHFKYAMYITERGDIIADGW